MDGADAMIFQSTLPARGATYKSPLARCQEVFQSTLPARGATGQNTISGILTELFQSTLPARGATRPRVPESPHRNFNPRSPHGERRRQRPKKKIKKSYFNPRSPHGERRGILSSPTDERRISIHAPRTGSDFRRSVKGFPPKYFNPRSPHGERRRQEPLGTVCPEISIHAPSTGSDRWDRPKTSGKGISIHAPRTGSDERIYQHLTFTHGFQSTLPARGATSSTFADLLGSAHFNPRSPHGERRAGESRLRRADSISIHAPRTGSDRESPAHGAGLHYFNPRSPHGERHAPHQRRPSAFDFNPRSPHGERRDAIAPLPTQRDFNPRSPHGERRQSSGAMSMTQIISIHAPRTGSDGVSLPRELRRIYFNPRSPHGERQAPSVSFLPGTYFNPRSPHGERPGEPPPCGGA